METRRITCILPIALLLLLLNVPVYAVDYYVCVTPDGSNPSGAGEYSESFATLNAAFGAVPANLVAGSTRFFIHIIGDWSGVTDVTQATLQGKTTDGNNYVDASCPTTVRGGVTVSARHGGKVTAGAYTLFSAVGTYAVQVDAGYTRLHGLQIRKVSGECGVLVGSLVGGNDSKETHVFDNIVYSLGGPAPDFLIRCAGFLTSGNQYIYNNILYGPTSDSGIYDGGFGAASTGITKHILHNTVLGGKYGITAGPRSRVWNNLVQFSSTDDFHNTGGAGPPTIGGYNISSGVGVTFFATDKVCTAAFVDATGASGVTDLHLASSDTCATGYAVDLSGTSPYRTLDIDGEALNGGSYDCGADECALAAPPPFYVTPGGSAASTQLTRQFLWSSGELSHVQEFVAVQDPWVSATDTTQDTSASLLGWYTAIASYQIPSEWPYEVAQRWNTLRSEGPTEEDTQLVSTWDRPQLAISTPWIQGKSDKTNAFLDIAAPEYAYFTYFTIEPSLGTVEQNFQGRARIYGLDETQEYIIRCYDAGGLVGSAFTTISDKYIRALPAGVDAWTGVRNPIMVKSLVEDPNGDLWAAVYEPDFNGSTYQFVNVYRIDSKTGQTGLKFTIPIYRTVMAVWEAALTLEPDGDATVVACEEPAVYGSIAFGFSSPSYAGRVEVTGSTVWEAVSTNIAPISSMTSCASGYVYAGAALMRSGVTGEMQNWGYTGTTTVYPPFIMRDVAVSMSGVTVATTGTSGYLDDIAGGACSTTFDGGGVCANAFDDNTATSVDEVDANNDTVVWDFGGGNAQSPTTVYIHAYSDRVLAATGVTWYVEYSTDNVTWITLGFAHSFGTETHNETWAYGGDAKRYWRVRLDGESALTTSHKLYEFILSGPLASGGGDIYPELATVCGGMYLYGAKSTDKYGGVATAEPCLGGVGAQYVFDSSVATWDSYFMGLPTGAEVFTFASSVTPSYFSVYMYNGSGVNVSGVVRYDSTGGGVWANASAVQTWANGTTVYREFAPSVTVGATRWMIYFDTGGLDLATRVFDFAIYDGVQTPYPLFAQFYLTSGVTAGGTQDMQGQIAWQTAFTGSTGYFRDMTKSARNGVFYAAGTDAYITDTNLATARGIVGSVEATGATRWFKYYPDVSVFNSISPCTDGGFLLAGTKYTSGVTQARKAVILKIDENGSVDSKFPQMYNESAALGSDGRAILETLEGGVLMGGGSSNNDGLSSKPYFVKLDRFYDCCSTGDLCE